MDWTSEEKEKYKGIREMELGSLYAQEGIPIDKPEIREIFLQESVLNLDDEDYNLLLEKNKKNGKAEALQMLEELVIEKFF